MKTKLFLSIVIALVVSSGNVLAGNAKTNVFTNVVNTEMGYNKEYTIFNSADMQEPVKRILCVYDADGTLKEKIRYEWESYKGWMESNKVEYTYDNSDRLIAVAFTQWDTQLKDWSKTSEINIYEEDRANMTLIVNESTVEASEDLAIIEKL